MILQIIHRSYKTDSASLCAVQKRHLQMCKPGAVWFCHGGWEVDFQRVCCVREIPVLPRISDLLPKRSIKEWLLAYSLFPSCTYFNSESKMLCVVDICLLTQRMWRFRAGNFSRSLNLVPQIYAYFIFIIFKIILL